MAFERSCGLSLVAAFPEWERDDSLALGEAIRR